LREQRHAADRGLDRLAWDGQPGERLPERRPATALSCRARAASCGIDPRISRRNASSS